jgi:plastocyanin
VNYILRIGALAVLGVAALVVAAVAFSGERVGTLVATDGPGYTITLNARSVKAGTYRIIVHDRASTHNFHLIGPGVNKATDLNRIYTVTWTVKLAKGTYRYICDPHASLMKGVLKVT